MAKFLEEVSGLLLTVLIISVGFGLWTLVKPLNYQTSEALAQQNSAIELAQFSSFDNHIVSGSQLVTAVRRYSYLPNFSVYVQKNTPSTVNFGNVPDATRTTCPGFNYTSGLLTYSGTVPCSTTQAQLDDATNPNYIPPQARFKSTLVKDRNNLITGIYFKQ
jgi:hypothetical protein